MKHTAILAVLVGDRDAQAAGAVEVGWHQPGHGDPGTKIGAEVA